MILVSWAAKFVAVKIRELPVYIEKNTVNCLPERSSLPPIICALE